MRAIHGLGLLVDPIGGLPDVGAFAEFGAFSNWIPVEVGVRELVKVVGVNLASAFSRIAVDGGIVVNLCIKFHFEGQPMMQVVLGGTETQELFPEIFHFAVLVKRQFWPPLGLGINLG